MDKREAVRVPVRIRAQCRGSGIVIDGTVEDLSRSGLFLRAPKWIRPGSSAEIDLEVPGEISLHLAAQVVRVDEGSDREGMAFRFVDDPDAVRPLANFIMRQHASFRVA